MEMITPLAGGLALKISDEAARDGGYPTRRLQRGLLLLLDGRDLAEEGVGFGVPVVKRGIQTFFPGGVELSARREGPVTVVTAAYEMNLVERLAKQGGGSIRVRSLYAAKNLLAALHRRAPVLRAPLTATSVALRRLFGWVTTFEETGSSSIVAVTYVIHAADGRVDIAVDTNALLGAGVTEVVVMNEQGARRFDRYQDSDGTLLRGDEIGTWDHVAAARASFVSSADRVAFSLGQVDGAGLRRGRELIGTRVAWSGFGYSFPPARTGFRYDVRIENGVTIGLSDLAGTTP